MKISIIGAGRWGTLCAWYQSHIGNTVLLQGRKNSEKFEQLQATRKNEYLELQEDIKLTSSLEEALQNEMIIISIPCQGLRNLCKEIKATQIDLKSKTLILAMKGLENSTGQSLTEVVANELGEDINTAVFVGPGHAQSITKKIPTCLIIDSANEETKSFLVENFSSDLIRMYKGNDLIGTEVGAATKNIIGIAAGMLDGRNISELKGALMARGTAEIARLIEACGGNKMSAYGLAHLGDYEATLFSPYSNNRMFGEKFEKGETTTKTTEGLGTIKAAVALGEKYNVELPITTSLYKIIFEGADKESILKELFARPTKQEF